MDKKPNIIRELKLFERVLEKSHLLLGPRQTGKSRLIAQQFASAKIYSLLQQDTYRKLLANPERLREEWLEERPPVVVIDEIQRVPALLDEVHGLIEEHDVRFLLTGSSARKLIREKGINRLGGRLRTRYFHPFSATELGSAFRLEQALLTGLLPSIWFSTSPWEDLGSYVSEYLTLEVSEEARVRNIPAFARFLEVAALSSGQTIDYTAVANDSQIPRTTIHEYFGILKDTLIAREVPAFQARRTRKPITTSKYYFFDVGILNKLCKRESLAPKTPEYGVCFEHWVFHELSTALDSRARVGGTLEHWRTHEKDEVDFIIDGHTAIEVKAKSVVTDRDLSGLRRLAGETDLKEKILVCLEKTARRTEDGIRIVPYLQWAKELRG